MGSDQFGVELQDLAKIQRDWHELSQKMEEFNAKLASIRSTIARAAEIDLAASPLAGIAGLGAAYQVVQDVREIQQRADALGQLKTQLTKELADDAQKIQLVIKEYEQAEQKIKEGLGKVKDPTPPPTSPKPSGRGGGGGGGGSHGGGGGGGGGSHGGGGGGGGSHGGGGGGGGSHGGGEGGGGGGGGGSDSYPSGQGTGDWKTTGNWDAWSPGKHHTTTGAGIETEPNTDGLSQDRKEALDRALDRVRHRIGYSQSAFTNGYRDDCSGFVSAAWGLETPGLNTWGLMESSVAHRITKDDLQPGDALIAGDHTVLFGGWADAAHTKYIALEDNGSQGTVSHVIPYPYYSGDAGSEAAAGHPYLPYRRNGMN
ncbi:hypothetical protein [Kitasatospora sp. GP82]|uniref:hypothetical protein n=1 Tax=Kitasatospora sp. GP82 TaxID=3035089 RepID=UPI002475FD58|nr:hypothetical protein [Kitasatospora sp. GP82]MDH6128920.1 prefoldin subunit 5 [Kitasatospora sp. GP82]